jgi:hypothetical protein
MWVDFLCHLHDDLHIPHVINKMGALYCEGLVWPLYLADFSAGVATLSEKKAQTGGVPSEALIDISRSVLFPPFRTPASPHVDATLDALRRGWIQQELSFGRLDRTVVAPFVVDCVLTKSFGLLGSLVRRRASAMTWLLSSYPAADKFGRPMTAPNTADLNDSESCDVWVLRNNARGLIGNLNHESPADGESSCVSAAIAMLLAAELSQSYPGVSSVNTMVAQIRRRLPALPPVVEQLVTELCKPQRFDPGNVFCAFQLLRSFSESALSVETDAPVAMTQCAARSAGFAWMAPTTVGAGEKSAGITPNAAEHHNAAVLRACWATIVDAASTNTQETATFTFAMRRTDSQHWTAGLGAIAELQAKLEGPVKKKGVTSQKLREILYDDDDDDDDTSQKLREILYGPQPSFTIVVGKAGAIVF